VFSLAERRPSGRFDSSVAADPHDFDPRETHGTSHRPRWKLHASSTGLGWRNLFVSSQTEMPEEADYGSVRHHLLVVHRNGPASVSLKIAGRSALKQIAPGGSTLCPGGEGFRVRVHDTVESAHIYLRHGMIERVIDERGIGATPRQMQPFFGIQEPLLEHLALACVAALTKPPKSTSLYVDYLAWAMAAHLVEADWGGLGASPTAHLGLTDRQMRRVEEYMLEHLDGNLGVEDLAAAAGLSPVYFARQFRLRTGSAPHRYFRSLKIKRAKQLLRSKYIPIAEIALICGFSHQQHMTRVFRNECDETPAAFRRGNS
jgi:AraC family transcriptional regulator